MHNISNIVHLRYGPLQTLKKECLVFKGNTIEKYVRYNKLSWKAMRNYARASMANKLQCKR